MRTRTFIAILVVLIACMIVLLLRHGDTIARTASTPSRVPVKENPEQQTNAPSGTRVEIEEQKTIEAPKEEDTKEDEVPPPKSVEQIRRLDFIIEPLIGTDAWFPRKIVKGQKVYAAVSIVNKGNLPVLVNLGDKCLHQFFRFSAFGHGSKDDRSPTAKFSNAAPDPILCTADYSYELAAGRANCALYEFSIDIDDFDSKVELWLTVDHTAADVFPQAYSIMCAAGWARRDVENSLFVCSLDVHKMWKEIDEIAEASQVEPELALCQALLSVNTSTADQMVVKRLQGHQFNRSSVAHILLSKVFQHQRAVYRTHLEASLKLVERKQDKVRYYMYEVLYGTDGAKSRFEEQVRVIRKLIEEGGK